MTTMMTTTPSASFQLEPPSSTDVRYFAASNGLSFGQVLQGLLENDGDNRLMDALVSLMEEQANSQPAFFFECAPVASDSLMTKPFRCAFVTAPRLAGIVQDREAFAEHFKATSSATVSFPNLSGDATLVAPVPREDGDFAHLATFVRTAPRSVVVDLLRRVASATLARVDANRGKPVWLSTSGLGVYYLHVRICDSPKYYTQRELTAAAAQL